VEFISNADKNDEYDVITLAINTLKQLGINYRFEIGDCRIFYALVNKENIGSDKSEELRLLIESKNYPALSEAAPASIAQLPKLFGGAEVFNKSDYDTSLLESIYNRLNDSKITVDLSLTDTQGYYTGILFNGYAAGFGKPILSGGRYRFNDTEGIGFAVNVSAVTALAGEQNLRKGGLQHD
jgi:ATP phosphoribosyltransferase regulatory subunit